MVYPPNRFQDKMKGTKHLLGDMPTKEKTWERSQVRLGESPDHDADVTPSERERDWRLSGSVLVCPASKDSSARPLGRL